MSSTLAAHHKVSLTAYDCAAARAAVYASTRCRSFDYLAGDMVRGGSASLRARVCVGLVKIGASGLARALVARTSPGADIYLFARTAVADDLVREALDAHADAQIVILGAGLDTTALRIGAERQRTGAVSGRFFEVDLPETQAEKRQHVSRLVGSRPDLNEHHLVYVPCAFGENHLDVALREAGFDASRPTIWIWSGVVHYLTERDVRNTLAELTALSTGDSKIFFDYTLLEAYERPDDYGFAEIKDRFDAFGEIMSFGFREGTDHVSRWLAEQGLRFIRLYTHRDMMAVYEQKTGTRAPSPGTPWSSLCIAQFPGRSGRHTR